ncbi:hypothetical protein COCHEDRAFT_1113263 [Bipolaris maydis C5]|uniref:Uncharacterized protein n=1 Tax=Cochliobolus heterostrophus (strain C5 / ATCC 48332 / race O) TaxID=701091 RepID=M2UHR6_COCH5|nr:hypothetical protein COCHEDRAFT_1113263 [Bipolaris maydis C5]KAJ6212059.1 P-loop containing nucleoside triphosphate hydrolase protein [Bipolaris maydis]
MNFNVGPDRADNTLPASRRQLEPFSMVPFAPDPDYVDRPDILAWIRDKCAGNGARAALVGLGGVGKSQIAIQYAHRIRDASPQTFIFWVHASTRARFEEAYKDIADRLQLPGKDDPKANVLQLVRNWLRDERNGKWFMVLDNVDDVETFFPSRKRKRDETDTDSSTPLAVYLPQSLNGAILVTSRSKDAASNLVGGHNKICEVLAMSTGEGLQLLRNKLCNPPLEESALKLLHELNCIPLAITQAAAYMNRCANMTVARYLDDFQKNDKKRECLLKWDVVELRRDESASSSILTTWQMSFDQIRYERPSAADLLSLMSFFSPQGIPEWTLRRFRNYTVRETATEDEEDEEEDHDCGFGEDLATLEAYSLVSTTADHTCEMHALVQFCTRVWLSSYGSAERWEGEFIELMKKELPFGTYKNWEKWQQLFPHIEPLFHSKPATRGILPSWAKVLKNAAHYFYEKGDFTTAAQIAAKILAVEEKTLGPSDMRTLLTMTLLAAVTRDQGRPEEAVKFSRQALEASTKALGEYDPLTLANMVLLASTLCDQGKHDEAENIHQKALEKYKKELGEKHYSTLSAKRMLASVMYFQNKYSDAERLFQEVLEVGKKELRENEDLMLLTMSDISRMLSTQGRYRESEKLCQQALEISTKKLGERHPDTLKHTCDLACSLLGLHRYAEATKLYQQAYNGLTEQYGSQHPFTVRCRRHFKTMQKKIEIAGIRREAHGQSEEDLL